MAENEEKNQFAKERMDIKNWVKCSEIIVGIFR